MREHRTDHERGHAFDYPRTVSGAAAKAQTPEEAAATRIYQLRVDVESAVVRARKLGAVEQRDAWREEKGKLDADRAALQEKIAERQMDAAISPEAKEHHDQAQAKLRELAQALDTAREPRAMPPVDGELDIEPIVLGRSVSKEDLLAWAAGLSSKDRGALLSRLGRVTGGSTYREDAFAVALSNHLAGLRGLFDFQKVLKEPRRFNRAAYERDRAARAAEDAAEDAAGVDAPAVVAEPEAPAPALDVGVEAPAQVASVETRSTDTGATGAASPTVHVAPSGVARDSQPAAGPVSSPPPSSGGGDAPDLPGAVESVLRAELAVRIGGDDTRAQVARRRRLEAICRSIAAPHRAALASRLTHATKGDALAADVRAELHPATVTRLVRALEGDPVALADVASPVTRAALDVEPGRMVMLDRAFAPTANVRVTPRAPEAPGIEGGPLTLRWVRRLVPDAAAPADDDRVLEPETDEGAWPLALTDGDAFVFQVRAPGRHHVRCEVAEGGVVIAVLEVDVEARESQRSAPSAYRTSNRPDEPWTRATDEGVQVKRGEDLAAAMSVPGENLAASFDAKRAQLATDNTLAPEQRAALADEVSVLEFAAAERQAPLPMPTPPEGAETVQIREWVLTDDPVYLRALLERAYARSDAASVDLMIADINEGLAQPDPNDADDPLQRIHARERIMPVLRSQWRTLRSEIDQFVDEFYWRARNAFHHRLEESQHVVATEMERYVNLYLPDPLRARASDPDFVQHDPAVELPKLQRAAAELVGSQRQLDEVRLRYRHAVRAKEQAENVDDDYDSDFDGEGATPYLPDLPAGSLPVVGEGGADLPALVESLGRMIEASEQEHSQRVLLAAAEYPILASYKRDVGERVEIDTGAVERLAGANAGAAAEKQGLDTLKNIERTRTAIEDGDLNIWKQPRVVDLARAEMLIAPGSVRDRAVVNQMAAAEGGDWKQWALAALTVALSLAAAIPTGGSSIVAGVVATAEVLTLAADLYVALDTLESYQIEKAAARTDFDKAKAISASEPSLLWVAIDVVAVGLDVKSMVSTFRAIRTAWHAARAGGVLDEAVAIVHAEYRAGRVSAEAAERLEREMAGGAAGASDNLADRVADDLVEDGDDALDAARSAPERRVVPDDPEHVDDALAERTLSGPARRVETRARVRTEDVASYERKLGAPVESNANLEDGVRVYYAEGKNGDILVTRVEVGPLALVDDVLAHRRTIERLTRYNGVVGDLRLLWDRFVALVGGSVHENPFRKFPGPGTGPFESFEEMRKIDELIQARRAAWTPDVLNADLVDDEIRHLQGELQRHSEVVREAQETLTFEPGRGFIERPGVRARTQEATAKKWPLPKDNPDAYYYRLSDTTPGAYELARLPSAPKELPSLHAEFEIVDGVPKPTGEIVLQSERVRAVRLFSDLEPPKEVLKGLRESPSTSAYLDMLTKTGERVDGAAPLATDDEIAEVIADIRKAKGTVNEDELRHALKERFRKRVEDFLTEPLDEAASYQRMRQTLDGLGVSDKGNWCEVWYQRRFAKQSERHVPIDVHRTDAAAGAEWLEDRKIDLFDGKTATEVKSGAGPLGAEGKDQFLAYIDMAEGRQRAAFKGKPRSVETIKYVFTDAAGARKNLSWMADILERRRVDFVIEVFDESGQAVSLRSVEQMRDFATRGVTP